MVVRKCFLFIIRVVLNKIAGNMNHTQESVAL